MSEQAEKIECNTNALKISTADAFDDYVEFMNKLAEDYENEVNAGDEKKMKVSEDMMKKIMLAIDKE